VVGEWDAGDDGERGRGRGRRKEGGEGHLPRPPRRRWMKVEGEQAGVCGRPG
jgi:hypothetical protein